MDVSTEDWVETCNWMAEESADEWPGLEIPVDGSPRMGAEKPSIMIVVFSDFECPHCSRAAAALKRIALEYPERQLIGRTVLEDVSMSLWVRGRGRPEREKLAVRALAVAYDLTAERKYLDVCRAWSDRWRSRSCCCRSSCRSRSFPAFPANCSGSSR